MGTRVHKIFNGTKSFWQFGFGKYCKRYRRINKKTTKSTACFILAENNDELVKLEIRTLRVGEPQWNNWRALRRGITIKYYGHLSRRKRIWPGTAKRIISIISNKAKSLMKKDNYYNRFNNDANYFLSVENGRARKHKDSKSLPRGKFINLTSSTRGNLDGSLVFFFFFGGEREFPGYTPSVIL